MKEERDEELRAAGLAPPGEKRAAEKKGRPLFPPGFVVPGGSAGASSSQREDEVRAAEAPVNRAATPRTAMRQGQRASDVADRAAAASGLADARRATHLDVPALNAHQPQVTTLSFSPHTKAKSSIDPSRHKRVRAPHPEPHPEGPANMATTCHTRTLTPHTTPHYALLSVATATESNHNAS